jgi:hypothetical protein
MVLQPSQKNISSKKQTENFGKLAFIYLNSFDGGTYARAPDVPRNAERRELIKLEGVLKL